VTVHDLFADRQAHASPWVQSTVVKALKDEKDPLEMSRLYTNTVVLDCELPNATRMLRRDVNLWGLLGSKLDRVRNEVLE
jgi:hypothetical protein